MNRPASTRLLPAIALFLLTVVVFLGSPRAHAFPEMVRHKYPNCTSCHVSPNGGGLLNAYGRQSSTALLSHGEFFFERHSDADEAARAAEKKKYEESGELDPEGKFLWGSVELPDWLNLGGDVRPIETFVNTPSYLQASFILMQADLEGAVTYKKLTLDATIGRQDPSNANPGFTDYVISRRHFALFQATDEISLQVGRYNKPYGINQPYHYSPIRQGLNWDQGTESYNVQASYIGDTYNAIVYGDLGRPDALAEIEKGFGATVSRSFADTYKIGASYFHGTNDLATRDIFGPWGILGVTDHLYLWTENDFVSARPAGGLASTFGFANYTRLGYEVTQGVVPVLVQEFGQNDLTHNLTQEQAYGGGLQYFPRAHWERELFYQKHKIAAAYPSFFDEAWLMMHFYP